MAVCRRRSARAARVGSIQPAQSAHVTGTAHEAAEDQPGPTESSRQWPWSEMFPIMTETVRVASPTIVERRVMQLVGQAGRASGTDAKVLDERDVADHCRRRVRSAASALTAGIVKPPIESLKRSTKPGQLRKLPSPFT